MDRGRILFLTRKPIPQVSYTLTYKHTPQVSPEHHANAQTPSDAHPKVHEYHLCRSLLSWPSSLFGNPPTLSAFFIISLPLSPSRSSIGNPHHSLWNLSCSILLASFASRSLCLFNLVANHSSLAASCSACVAWIIIQLFMARFCCRHLKGAVKVRPRAQSANSTCTRFSTGMRIAMENTDVLSQQHSNFSLVNDTSLELELPVQRKVGEDSVRA
jgi:hypothetical protein